MGSLFLPVQNMSLLAELGPGQSWHSERCAEIVCPAADMICCW